MDQDQVKELRELIELLKANDIAEFDMEQPDFKVRLKFVTATVAVSSEAGQPSRPGTRGHRAICSMRPQACCQGTRRRAHSHQARVHLKRFSTR